MLEAWHLPFSQPAGPHKANPIHTPQPRRRNTDRNSPRWPEKTKINLAGVTVLPWDRQWGHGYGNWSLTASLLPLLLWVVGDVFASPGAGSKAQTRDYWEAWGFLQLSNTLMTFEVKRASLVPPPVYLSAFFSTHASNPIPSKLHKPENIQKVLPIPQGKWCNGFSQIRSGSGVTLFHSHYYPAKRFGEGEIMGRTSPPFPSFFLVKQNVSTALVQNRELIQPPDFQLSEAASRLLQSVCSLDFHPRSANHSQPSQGKSGRSPSPPSLETKEMMQRKQNHSSKAV